ncbi:MAG TPA: DUF5668 domain-containing protein [Thermoanaerobaculia bacterium]|nr:DUF5668 domain-containing protein [Thermoanaerobaculia bacterium]HQR68050.1 DUF5668 domain-containing protein [Thermoanaerobaculia bacterium]
MNEPAPPRPPASIGKLVFGVIVAILGVLFTLENFGLVDVGSLWKYWPLALVAVGGAHLSQSWRSRPFGGLLLVVLGVFFLLQNLHVIRISLWNLFPLVLVIVGLRIVFGALGGREARWDRPGETGASDAWLRGFVAFGGLERRITSPQFQGGDVGAFCGGWELDLSKAKLAGKEARLDVFAWWGGGEVRVPEDWNVSVRVLPILGGTHDRTRHPQPGTEAGTLVVTGTVVMGGVEIKN